MQDETQIKSEVFPQILCGLLKSKLLTCSDISEDDLEEELKENAIKMNYIIRIANDFKRSAVFIGTSPCISFSFVLSSKKIEINLKIPLKSVEQKDIEGLYRTIEEDRKMVIQAAIVRRMKARQTLKHALLIQEVIPQLSSR